jgi:hypothetical protein
MKLDKLANFLIHEGGYRASDTIEYIQQVAVERLPAYREFVAQYGWRNTKYDFDVVDISRMVRREKV